MELMKDTEEIPKENLEQKKTPKVQAPVAQYDPHKRYQWHPTDQFVLSGEEFSLVLNSLRTFLARPESQAVLRAEKAHYAIEDVIARNVEMGIVKEMKEPTKEQDPTVKNSK